mgnify:CR=1 FL=1
MLKGKRGQCSKDITLIIKVKVQSSKFKGQCSKFKASTDACHHFQCEDSVACKIAKH